MDLSLGWSRRGVGGLERLGELTAFADYRMPQILRHCGILTLSPTLADAIEARRELPAGSREEIELRAATVQAVEAMRAALARQGRAAPSWRIDFDLWLASHSSDIRIDHHRTRTICY